MLESELYDREFDDAGKSGRGAGEGGVSGVGPAIPAAVFQPPQVLFQPPDVRPEAAQQPASGARSRGNGSAGAAVDPKPDADGADNGDGPDGADGADGRRRRRRPSRARTRAGGGDGDQAADADGADTGHAEEAAPAAAEQPARTPGRRTRRTTSV